MAVHAVDAIQMALERGHERLGKQPVQLGGVDGPHIFTGPLKGMQRWIGIALDDENVALALPDAALGRPLYRLDPLQTHDCPI